MYNEVHNTNQILLVENSEALARCYSEYLSKEDVDISVAFTGERALEDISRQAPPVILLDLQVDDIDAFDVLRYVQDENVPSSVIVITSDGGHEVSRRVMDMGAVDYLEKPFNRDRLCVTVRNALQHKKLQRIVDPYEKGFYGFVGSSLQMQSVYRIIESSARSKATVFITGESGTGKEVCAQAIHDHSDRHNHEFVALNCAAIPKDLIESEIFGHIKGSFTGAVNNRDGAATRANNGTLFLDEIGEMELSLQSKLLRFIQTGTFQRVGGTRLEQVDVRFVCATNRDPLRQVAEGTFREDLYYRLHVVPIPLPALRDRGQDIMRIANNFLSKFAKEEGKRFVGFAEETERFFMRYEWPGNVRQLQNVVRNVVVLHDGELVLLSMLPDLGGGEPSAANQSSAVISADLFSSVDDIISLRDLEMRAIDRAIELCEGNVTEAAKHLKVSPSTIYRKKPRWRDD